jgi:alkaline phosphatase
VAEDLLQRDNRLNMTRMEVQGMQTTFDSFALMTDSASSATAFAGGIKTKSAVIGMDHTLTRSFKSVAQLAQEQGKKVGIISSVPLNHATPAAYYASVSNRGMYNSIATQMWKAAMRFSAAAAFYPLKGLPGMATPATTSGAVGQSGYEVLKTATRS